MLKKIFNDSVFWKEIYCQGIARRYNEKITKSYLEKHLKKILMTNSPTSDI